MTCPRVIPSRLLARSLAQNERPRGLKSGEGCRGAASSDRQARGASRTPQALELHLAIRDPLEDVLEPAQTVMLAQARSGNATTDLLTTLLWHRLQAEGRGASLATGAAGLAGGELADGRGATVRP